MHPSELFELHSGFFDLDFVRRTHTEAAGKSDWCLIDLILDQDNTAPFDPNCLFDDAYYRTQLGESAVRKCQNPVIHYFCEGAAESISPNMFFDVDFFHRSAGSVAKKTETIVVTAVKNFNGKLAPLHPFVDQAFIRDRQNDVSSQAFYEALFRGKLMSDSPHPLFDAEFYIDRAREAFGSTPQRPFEHFVTTGQILGLNPSPFFDVAYVRAETGYGDALNQLRARDSRLAEVLAANPPAVAFIQGEHILALADALTNVSEPKAMFGGTAPNRFTPNIANRLPLVADQLWCSSDRISSHIRDMLRPEGLKVSDGFHSGDTKNVDHVCTRNSREITRGKLGVPDDAFVVVGSGALDIENGVDLFGVFGPVPCQTKKIPAS